MLNKKPLACRRAFSRKSSKVALLLVLVMVLGSIGLPALTQAAPSSGLVNVTATVNGPPPSVAASIDLPSSEQVVTFLPVNVSGTCPVAGLIIKIVDNGAFVGSTNCKSGGSFSVAIDLFRGKNDLVAQVFDALGQKGPDSNTVTVYYNPVVFATASPTTKLTIELDSKYSGYTGYVAGQQLSLPLRINGGTPPYAVHIDRGDGSDNLVSLQSVDEPLIAAHIYSQAGAHQITITASDNGNQKATLSEVVIINGQPKSVTLDGPQKLKISHLPWGYMPLGLVGFMLGKMSRRTKSPN